MQIIEINSKFKIWRFRDSAFLCKLINGEWQDLEFDTKEEAEKEIEQTLDHEKAINTGDWETYCKKWNVVLE
jgi:hypothetical protein